jgi:hypothetical protein
MPDIKVYKVKISKNKLPAKVSLPPDFISFCEDQDASANGKFFVLDKFVGYRDIILTGNECTDTKDYIEYHIYYNAMYPSIVDGGQNFNILSISEEPPLNEDNWKYVKVLASEYEIPDIVGNLVPHYIVSQLLSQDDKVRSIEELNTFETLLATVNVDRNVRQRKYHSSRGWY